MANRRGGYNYGNPYSAGNNTKRSPFSKPFVDYSKGMGSRMKGWLGIHKEQFDKIDERIAANKTDYATFMEEAQNEAVFEGGEMQGHQLDGSTYGGQEVAGEAADLRGLVQDYRNAWLKSRGITEKKKYDKDGNVKNTKTVGWGKSTDTSAAGLEGRIEAGQIKGYITKAGKQKSLYKELQNALYNDETELGILSGHNDENQMLEYKKFMDPRNKTKYDKKGNLIIIAEDGTEKFMSELSKMQPELRNAKIPGEINKINDIVVKNFQDYTILNTDPDTGETTYSIDQSALSAAIAAGTGHFKDADWRDWAINWSREVIGEDGTVKTSNYFNSDESQIMQLMYQGIFEDSKTNPNDVNHGLTSGRDEKGGMPDIIKHNKDIDEQIFQEVIQAKPDKERIKELESQKKEIDPTHGMKRKWFNDHNFILDKDVFAEGSDARNNLVESLKEGGVDGDDLNKVVNYLNSYQDPSGAAKTMPISNYLEHGAKRFMRNVMGDQVNNKLNKNQAASRSETQKDLVDFNREMMKKYGEKGPKVSDLVARALNFEGVETGRYNTNKPIDIKRLTGMLIGVNDGGKTGAKLSVNYTKIFNSTETGPPSKRVNLIKGDVIKLSWSAPSTTTATDDTTTKAVGQETKESTKYVSKDQDFELEYTGDKSAFHTAISNFLAGSLIESAGGSEEGNLGLGGSGTGED